MMRRWFKATPIAPILLGLSVLAAETPSTETLGNLESIETIRSEFDYGKYEQVLAHAEMRIDQGGAPEHELIALHQYAAVSAFNEHKLPVAEKHFKALLRLDPDARLDPFIVPPPAIELFVRLRTQVASELPHWRVERQLRLENSQKGLKQLTAEKYSLLSDPRTKIGYNPLINFVPFGFPQFSQGRKTAGWIFGLSEGALAVASLGALGSYYALMSPRLSEVTGSRGTFVVRELGIIPRLQNLAHAFRIINLVTAIAFYAVYGIGVWDAFAHQKPAPALVERQSKPKILEIAEVVASPGQIALGLRGSF